MIQLIAPDCHEDFADDLHAMHRLRYRVFKERLDWQVKGNGGYEVDSFDALRPLYLLLRGSDGSVDGACASCPPQGRLCFATSFPCYWKERRRLSIRTYGKAAASRSM